MGKLRLLHPPVEIHTQVRLRVETVTSLCDSSASWHKAGCCRRCRAAAVSPLSATTDSCRALHNKKSHAGKQRGRGPHPPTATPLQLSLKYMLTHQTTGMSVSDRQLEEQHGLWRQSVHTHRYCTCSTRMPETRLHHGESKHIAWLQ